MQSDFISRVQANAARAEELEPLTIVLRPGQRVRIELAETDGHFDIAFDEQDDGLVTVYSTDPASHPPVMIGDLPQTIVYVEDFRTGSEFKPIQE